MTLDINSPILALQKNVDQFCESFEKKYSKEMTCKKGCSACCHQDLSVFPIEADVIRQWFQNQPDSLKSELIATWKLDQATGADTSGHPAQPCSFLYKNACTIYAARPMICRSQGVALKWVENESPQYDVCPLNFTDGDFDKQDALDIDRLQTLQSIAQVSTKATSERVKLSQIKQELGQKNS